MALAPKRSSTIGSGLPAQPSSASSRSKTSPSSLPAPVIHSPPRTITTVEDQQNWKIPPCISNWKNIKGYATPVDMRLAADARGSSSDSRAPSTPKSTSRPSTPSNVSGSIPPSLFLSSHSPPFHESVVCRICHRIVSHDLLLLHNEICVRSHQRMATNITQRNSSNRNIIRRRSRTRNASSFHADQVAINSFCYILSQYIKQGIEHIPLQLSQLQKEMDFVAQSTSVQELKSSLAKIIEWRQSCHHTDMNEVTSPPITPPDSSFHSIDPEADSPTLGRDPKHFLHRSSDTNVDERKFKAGWYNDQKNAQCSNGNSPTRRTDSDSDHADLSTTTAEKTKNDLSVITRRPKRFYFDDSHQRAFTPPRSSPIQSSSIQFFLQAENVIHHKIELLKSYRTSSGLGREGQLQGDESQKYAGLSQEAGLAALLRSKLGPQKLNRRRSRQRRRARMSRSSIHGASIKDFNLIERLSQGGIGEVFLARKKQTGDIFAIKVINRSHIASLKDSVERVVSERRILSHCHCPFVVRLFYSFVCRKSLYLVMEYMPGSDVGEYLAIHGPISEEQTRDWMAQVLLGLEYLHDHGVVHRDIKPDNMLLSKSRRHLKLADFGLSVLRRDRDKGQWIGATRNERTSESVDMSARSNTTDNTISGSFYGRSGLRFSGVGTNDYLAPEILLGIGHDAAADWWSFGASIFECLTGMCPFHADDVEAIHENILTRNIQWCYPFSSPESFSLSAWDLIDRLLCLDPSERYGSDGIAQVKLHPFWIGIDWEKLKQECTEADQKLHSSSFIDPSSHLQINHTDSKAQDSSFTASSPSSRTMPEINRGSSNSLDTFAVSSFSPHIATAQTENSSTGDLNHDRNPLFLDEGQSDMSSNNSSDDTDSDSSDADLVATFTFTNLHQLASINRRIVFKTA